jgi:hypothetical protein
MTPARRAALHAIIARILADMAADRRAASRKETP